MTWRQEGFLYLAVMAAFHVFGWWLGNGFLIGVTMSPLLIVAGALLYD